MDLEGISIIKGKGDRLQFILGRNLFAADGQHFWWKQAELDASEREIISVEAANISMVFKLIGTHPEIKVEPTVNYTDDRGIDDAEVPFCAHM